VRFADEICENRHRASNYLLTHGNLPKHSEVFHKYAASITGNVIKKNENRINLKYTININDLSKPWGCAISGDKTENYLVDEILERLEKMDRERRYCNMFSREIYTVDSIRASIEIIDDNHDVLESISIPELCDSGYPDENKGFLKDQLKEFCGYELFKRLSQKT